MAICNLKHVPENLHTNNRQPIEIFMVGEYMYRRCNKEDIDNPFKSISLTELSHNRSGFGDNILSNPEDVLYNIKEGASAPFYEDQVICKLKIVSLSDENKYKKKFSQIKNEIQVDAYMELLHQPEPCMFPHCVFRIWVGHVIVTYDNYKELLNNLQQIKTQIRQELVSMIVTSKISHNDS